MTSALARQTAAIFTRIADLQDKAEAGKLAGEDLDAFKAANDASLQAFMAASADGSPKIVWMPLAQLTRALADRSLAKLHKANSIVVADFLREIAAESAHVAPVVSPPPMPIELEPAPEQPVVATAEPEQPVAPAAPEETAAPKAQAPKRSRKKKARRSPK